MSDEERKNILDLGIKVEADVTLPVQNLSEVVCNAANFIGRILGPTLESIGGIVSDQFQYWRALNIQRLQGKWEKLRKERGASADVIQRLPLGLGVRLIDAASQEDDDSVQDLWAGLLDAATDPARAADVHRVHVEILRSLTVVEAQVLRFMALRQRSKITINVSILGDEELQRFSIEDRALAIQNLKRLGCIRLKLNRMQMAKIRTIKDILAPNINVSKDRLRSIVDALANLIADVSGTRDDEYLKPRQRGLHQKLLPELSFELTNLGLDLMNICEPPKSDREN